MKRSYVEGLLKDLEIEESVRKQIIEGIMNENGNDINNEKSKAESLRNDLKIKESLIDELNGKLKTAGEVDIEAIKKEQYDLGLAKGTEELENMKKQNALKSSIKGARDFELVYSKMDKDKIEFAKQEDGSYEVKGLDEQLENVKENYSYLFEEENNNQSTINLGGNHNGEPTIDSDMDRMARAMGLPQKDNK